MSLYSTAWRPLEPEFLPREPGPLTLPEEEVRVVGLRGVGIAVWPVCFGPTQSQACSWCIPCSFVESYVVSVSGF